MAMEQKRQERTRDGQENLQSQSALRCEYCGCDTNEDVIKAAFWTETGLIVIEDIPAWLCEGCGEQFFDEEITQRIQQVITYPAGKAKRRIRVPIYSLSQVRVAKKEHYPQVPNQQHPRSLEISHHQAKQAVEPIGANQDHQETFLCKYCESETVEDLVKSAFWVDGGLVVVENIPARVCQQCRQQFYDHETAEKITTLEKGKLLPGTARRDVWVPVFSLSDIEVSPGKNLHQEKSDGLEQMPPPISKTADHQDKDNG